MSTRSHVDPSDQDTTLMEYDFRPRLPVSKWREWRRAILGTIGAIGLYVAAILCLQPAVVPQPGPVLTEISAGQFRIAEPYQVVVSVPPRIWLVSIANGFRTDGASIPRDLRYPLGLKPTSPCLIRGGVVHDALYAAEALPRELCDAIFLALILEDGTAPAKARAVHRAVSDCGGVVWSRHTAGSVREAREMVRVEELTL